MKTTTSPHACTRRFIPARVDPSGPAISLPDTEKTFDELLARVKRTIEYLESIEEKAFEGKEGSEVVISMGDKEARFSAAEYVLAMAQPNFWYVLSWGVEMGFLFVWG
jgi:hypothetical protein